jgi:NAD+ synthase (glutamine-hydrolysing)
VGNVRVAVAQLNTVVGDIPGNTARVIDAIERARRAGAAITLVPEMALPGYPAEDLLVRPEFAAASRRALDEVAATVTEGAAIIGFVDGNADCHNAAAVVANGRVQAVYHKRFLPNYGVFDEARYFQAGSEPLVVDVLGARVGIVICEDIWYSAPVAGDLANARLDLICCISASPYHRGKGEARERMLATRAADCAAALAFCNLVGGQDELIFDGCSAVFDPNGEVVARCRQFEEDFAVAEIEVGAATRRRLREPLVRRVGDARPPAAVPVDVVAPATANADVTLDVITPRLEPAAELWGALVLGIRDYVDKNGFPGVLIGLSGGIDSALTAALAVDALGAARVAGVAMPSVYSSPSSLADARALAASLGIALDVVPIAPIVAAFGEALAPVFGDAPPGVAEENIQARVRGTLLMAISNKHGRMVLATGNKSEIAVGYSTLYGDMVGGFAPIRDVSKTAVYELSRWRNASAGREVIPGHSIDRPPSAELRPDQRDTDSLPEYDVLDPILRAYVERDLDAEALEAAGAEPDLVRKVVGMVDRAEYKRRQGPIGIKITPRAFGKDRRMPITNRYA